MQRNILTLGLASMLALANIPATLAGDAGGGDGGGGGFADTIEQRGPFPTKVAGAATASAAEIGRAMAACDGRVRIVDVRDRATFNKGHIPGATLATVRTSSVTRRTEVSIAPADKERVCITVVYGAHDRDPAAPTAVQVAVETGHANVHWLRGGYAEWRKERFPVE